MSLYQTQGFPLRSTPYAEADKIVWFYTHQLGKVKAIVKGARKPKSRLAPLLELFTESSLTFHKKGGGDLYGLGQAKLLNSHPLLKKDLSTITLLQVMSDLLLQALPEAEPQDALYRLIRKTLKVLEVGRGSREQILVAFALRFLDLAGYPLGLDSCVECGASLERKKAILVPHRGGALCGDCVTNALSRLTVSPSGLQILRKLRSLPLEKVSILKIQTGLMRAIFLNALEYVAQTVEKPLKTLEYYLKILPTYEK